MRILVAEDHPTLGRSLKEGLEKRHYAVDLVPNGEDAYALGCTIAYDLIVLDIMLPDLDGFQVCQRLRARNVRGPILFLTALGQVSNRVKGLNLGGDDYLTKPFAFREFEARVRALLRRHSPVKTATLQFLDIVLDTATSEVRRGTRRIELGHKEFALLELLMRHQDKVVSRAMIVEHVWDLEASNLSNVIDVYIRYLRLKLCAEGEVNVIQTIRSIGFRLREPVS
ncbi:MAG TPA: response regulator transcription factor [Ktedonobacteraceae bacterium]|jgi:DNA-binding response OmpR family regulator